MKTTIRDLARETSLSVGTISMALNDSSKIKEETKRKVFRAMRKLNYDPTNRLQLIQRLKVKTLGLVIPAVATTRAEFYQRAVLAVQQQAVADGYDCMIFDEQDVVSRLGDAGRAAVSSINCDGLIVFSPLMEWDGYIAALRRRGMPVALIRRSTGVAGVTVVTDDDKKGTRLALEHLRRLGHIRIGYVGRDIGHGKTAGRKRAFDAFMKETYPAGAPFTTLELLGLQERERAALVAQMVAGPHPPTALMCDSDRSAAQTITALSRLGKRVPYDMAVVGYNDDPLADIYNPGITTVRVPVEKMVAAACRMLFGQVTDDAGDGIRMEVANRLVVRESCGSK